MAIAVILLYGLLDPSVWPFPRCPFLMLTGLQCPGCGSQRAIHHALQGSFGQSMQFNPMFLPGIVYALIGYGTSIFFPGHWPEIKDRYYSQKAAWIVLVIILVYWIVRNLI